MLVCYGTEALGSHLALERTIRIPDKNHYAERIRISGTNENIAFFFNRTTGPIFMLFLSDFHIFLSSIPIKPTVFNNSVFGQARSDPSSLAKGYDSGPPSLHPWRI